VVTGAASWQAGQVPVSGGWLAYHRTGGAGPALVLSHGLTDNGLCWERLAAALAPDFDVIMLDARGHGASARIAAGQTCDPGADLAEALAQLDLPTPIVMGHSVGALATAAYASAFPDRVAMVVLEDPPLALTGDAAAQADRRKRFLMQVAAFQTMSDADLAALGEATHPDWLDGDRPAWIAAKRQTDPRALPSFPVSWTDTLSRITAPTLLIYGEAARGSLVTPALADQAMRLNPAISAAPIVGAGHNVRRENFQDYLAAVRGFLRAAARG